MKSLRQEYKYIFSSLTIILLISVALVFLVVSLVINYAAGIYASEIASNSVSDILLNRLPVWNVNVIFVDGAVMFWFFITGLLILQPRRVPFTIKSIALFITIRSFFIILTHIAPFPQHSALSPNIIMDRVMFSGDLFFSGHTGLPFLMALIYWSEPYLRFLFLACSLIFGSAALLGHLHYTIDVLGAFFITYTIYDIAKFLFKFDLALFNSESFAEHFAKTAKKIKKSKALLPRRIQKGFQM